MYTILGGNFIGSLSRKNVWILSPLSHSQTGQTGISVRMHLVKANVMPYPTVTPQNHHSLFNIFNEKIFSKFALLPHRCDKEVLAKINS